MNKRGKTILAIILISILILVSFLLIATAANIIEDEEFELNSENWTETASDGAVADRDDSTQQQSGLRSGETNTKDLSVSTGSASLNQSLNDRIDFLNGTYEFSWYARWQENSSDGAKDCYVNVTSNESKSLIYWYNLSQTAPPANTTDIVFLIMIDPTWQTWTQYQRNFYEDWVTTAGFPAEENVSNIYFTCEGNYTSGTCSGTLDCSLASGESECDECGQCSWSDECLPAGGGDPDCSQLNAAECAACEVCNWEDECVEMGTPCNELTEEAQCDACGAACGGWGVCNDNGNCASCGSETECNTDCAFAGCSGWSDTNFGQEWYWDTLLLNDTEGESYTAITECGWINDGNCTDNICKLTQDIHNATNCLIINTSNITIDCQGHTITYAYGGVGYGVYASNKNNITLQGCTINQNSSSNANSHGIYISTSENSTFFNNTITTRGTGSIPIIFTTIRTNISLNSLHVRGATSAGAYFLSGSNNTIDSNVIAIYDTASSGEGITLDVSVNNTIIDNNITDAGGGTCKGIHLVSSSHFNNVSNNVIYMVNTRGLVVDASDYNTFSMNNITCTDSLAHMVELDDSHNNTFNNEDINPGVSGSGSGFFIKESNGTNITNSDINSYNIGIHLENGISDLRVENTTITAIKNDTFFEANSSAYVNYTNVTFDETETWLVSGSSGELLVKWFVQVKTLDIGETPVGSVSVWGNNTQNTAKLNDSFAETSGADGNTTWNVLTEYIENDTARFYFSAHNFSGVKTDYLPGYNLSNISYNFVGNQSVVIKLTDQTGPPAVSFVNPTPYSGFWQANASVTINVSVTDSASNIANCTIDWDGTNLTMNKVGSGQSVHCNYENTSIAEDTPIWYRVYAYDDAAELGKTAARNINVDLTNPIAEFGTNPANNSNLTSSTVYFEAKCHDNMYVDDVYIYGNWSGAWGSKAQNQTPKNDTIWNTSLSLSDGTYVWAIRCVDLVDRENITMNRTLTINAGSMVVKLYSPLNNTGTKNTTVLFNCSGQDTNGLTNVSLYGNWTEEGWHFNETKTSSDYNSSTWYNDYLKVLPEGIYVWNCYVCDTLGTCSFATTNNTFIVDEAIPQLDFVDPTPATGNVTNKSFFEVNVTVKDVNNGSAFIDLNRSLLGYWGFEKVTGTSIQDNSTWNNEATLMNGTLRTFDGKFGRGIKLDNASDNWVNLTFPGNLTDWSFSIWFKLDRTWDSNSGGNQYVYESQGTNPDIYLYFTEVYDGKLNFRCVTPTDNLITTTDSWTAGQWYHVAITYDHDTTTKKIYVDGVLEDSASSSCPMNRISGYHEIGSHQGGLPGYFDGTIDEVYLMNRTLSAAEVLALYDNAANTLDINFTGMDDSYYEYYAFATDRAGNTNRTFDTRTILINTGYPLPTLNGPLNNSIIGKDPIVFNCTTSDISGLKNISLFLTNGTIAVEKGYIGYPRDIAVDNNDNVWVCIWTDNQVTKMYSNGSVIGNYTVGSAPSGLAIDSTNNVWVCSGSADMITKLDNDGNIIGNYSLGRYPTAVAVDSNDYIWVVDNRDEFVTKLDNDGNIIGNYSVGDDPESIAVDSNDNIWVGNNNGRSITKLYNDGSEAGEYSLGSNRPNGLAVDSNDNIWVAAGDVIKLYNNGSIAGTYEEIEDADDVAVDSDDNVWVVDNQGGRDQYGFLIKLNSSNISLIESYQIPGTSNYIAIDSSNSVWTANSGYSSNSTTKKYQNNEIFSAIITNTSMVGSTTTTTNLSVGVYAEGTYEWNCLACDVADTCNFSTNNYTFTIDRTFPQLDFVDPTPEDANVTDRTFAYINVTTNDLHNGSAFIDWNRTLVGYWSFDSFGFNYGDHPDILDNSTWGNHMDENYSNPLLRTDGKFGKGMFFDGTDDYYSADAIAGDELDPTTSNFTLSAWIKTSDVSGTIISRYAGSTYNYVDHYLLEVDANGKASFKYSSGGVHPITTSTTSVNDGEWHHVAAVRLHYTYGEGSYGEQPKIYVDGKMENQSNWSGSTDSVQVEESLCFGVKNCTGVKSNYFKGTLDEIQFHMRALSHSEINGTYNNTIYRAEGNITGLVEGSYQYSAISIDKAGNINRTENRTFVINGVFPEVTLHSPKSTTATKNTTVLFNCSAWDGNGLENVSVYGNWSGDWHRNDTNTSAVNNASDLFLITNLNEGIHKWNCQACDLYGGCSFADSNNTFIVDTTLPHVDFVSPTPDNGTSTGNESIVVNLTTSDTNLGSVLLDWNRTLVAYWGFEEPSGTGARDNSTWDNVGVITGGAVRTIDGKFGKGLYLDGGDGYVGISDSNSLDIDSNSITIEAWVKPGDCLGPLDDIQTIIEKQSTWYLNLENNTCKPQFYWYGLSPEGYFTSQTAVSTNTWSYVAAVYDGIGDTVKIYINGKLVQQNNSVSGDGSENSNAVRIGGYGTSRSFNGTIDEIKIHSRALTASEINASYDNSVYKLLTNITPLTNGTYLYYALATDKAGNINRTENRTLINSIQTLVYLDDPDNDTDTFGVGTDPVNVTFNCSAIDNGGLKNISLYGNWTAWNRKNTTSVSGTTNGSVWYNLLTEATYRYTCQACNLDEDCAYNATNYTFNAKTVPSVEFVHPTPSSGGYGPINLTINTTVTDNNLGGTTIIFDDSLRSYLAFNQKTGTTARDNSTFSNDGTLENNTQRTPNGKFGWGIDLISADQNFVEIPDDDSLDAADEFTIELWFKTNATGSLISKGDGINNGFDLRLSESGGVYDVILKMKTDDAASEHSENETFTDDVWHHLAVTYDANENSSENVIFYFDGKQLNRDSGTTGNLTANTAPLRIGRTSSLSTPRYFNGSMDEIKIHNRALTHSEINASYNNVAFRAYTTIYNLINNSQHNFSVIATDDNGNMNHTDTRTITIDGDVPQITILSPTNTTYASTTVYANITTNENVSWCRYRLDTTNRTLTKVNNTYLYRESDTLSAGAHNITFFCNDTAGNWNQSNNVVFTINEAPNLSYINPTEDHRAYIGKNFTVINVSVTDTDATSACLLEWDGVNESATLTEGPFEITTNTTVQLTYQYMLADVFGENSQDPHKYAMQFKWQWLSETFPKTAIIEEAKMCLYWVMEESEEEHSVSANVSRIKDDSWTEQLIVMDPDLWNRQALTNITEKNWTNVTAGNWGCIDVTEAFKEDYDLYQTRLGGLGKNEPYSSFRIENMNSLVGDQVTSVSDASGLNYGQEKHYLIAEDRENTLRSFNMTYLNVTYSTSETTVNATCSINKSDVYGEHTYNMYANDSANSFGSAGERIITFGNNVNECMNLTEAGYYTITKNLESEGTCIWILADNVTLVGNNHNIMYATVETGYGIISLNDYSTISEIQIIQRGETEDSHGILMRNGFYGDISENTFSVLSNNAAGIYYQNHSNSTQYQNTIRESEYGIYVDSKSNHNNFSSDIIYNNEIDIFIADAAINNSLDQVIIEDDTVSISYDNINGDVEIKGNTDDLPPPTGLVSVNRSINLTTTSGTPEQVNMTLSLYYTDDEIQEGNIGETSLKIYRSNHTWRTPTAIQDSSGENDTFWENNTIDNSTLTHWTHNSSELHTITFDLGKNYNIGAIRIYTDSFSQQVNSSPCGALVNVSENTTDWLEMADQNFSSIGSTTEWHKINFNLTQARYVKLILRTYNGSLCSNYNYLDRFFEFDALTGSWLNQTDNIVNSSSNYVQTFTSNFSIFGVFGEPGVLAPPNVSISLISGNNTKINWSQVSGASGYYIYYSDDNVSRILLLDDATGESANVTLTGSSNNTWNDTTANTTFTRFYAVSAYVSEIQNFSTRRFGKHTLTIRGNASNNTLVGLPLNYTTNVTTIASPNNFAYVASYDENGGVIFRSYHSGAWRYANGTAADYELESGLGYYFKTFDSDVNFTNIGEIPRGNTTRTILGPDLNNTIIGFQSYTNISLNDTLPSPPNENIYVATYGTNGNTIYRSYHTSSWRLSNGTEEDLNLTAGLAYYISHCSLDDNFTYERNP